jgi:uncharacterized membrane protein
MMNRFLRVIGDATRRYFVAGILLFAPIGMTLWAITWIVDTLDNLLLPGFLQLIPGIDANAPPDIPPFLGLIFTFAAILIIGVIARDVLGHEIVRVWERFLGRVPIIGRMYNALRQLFEAVVSSGDQANFRRVVLIEYPRKGIYAIAFVSNTTQDSISQYLPEPTLNCFLPTTPNPTSGFYLLVPEREVIDVDFTVEEAFKLIMSAGLVPPSRQTASPSTDPASNPEEQT